MLPTGRAFSAVTGSDDGSFSLSGIALVSPYVLLDCDGFYFNEVSGKLSATRINLMALADLQQGGRVNINILTHLERRRVENLVSQGSSFGTAKEQAQQEVLAVFGISDGTKGSSEQAELCGSDPSLLAVSSIIQGYRSEAEVTELLSIISQNIAETGTIENKEILNSLANDGRLLSAGTIKNNLETRYSSLGMEVNIPDISNALGDFTQSPSSHPYRHRLPGDREIRG